MPESSTLNDALNDALTGAWVDDAVFALRPDYRVMLLAVEIGRAHV